VSGGQRLAGRDTVAGPTRLDDAARADVREQATAATAQTKTQKDTT
jgi:hypothetical protein